jgi:hypothetical protein
MNLHLRRRPHLLAEVSETAIIRGSWRGLAFGAYFLVIGVVSLVAPQVAAYLPFGIILISIWLGSARTGSRHGDKEMA